MYRNSLGASVAGDTSARQHEPGGYAVPVLLPAKLRTSPLLTDLSPVLSRRARRHLAVAVLGSLVVAFAEIAGVAALVPLLQILTGSSGQSGSLSWVSRLTGLERENDLALAIAAFVFAAFLLKSGLTLAFRWWMLGFINQLEADTASRLLRSYLAAPYWMHLQRSSAGLLRTMMDAVSQTYSSVMVGLIGVATEVATLVGIIGVLMVVMPIPASVVFVYFGGLGLLLHRQLRHRSYRAGQRLLNASHASYVAALQSLSGVKEITVRRKADFFAGEFAEARGDLSSAKRVVMFLGEVPRYALELVFTLGVALTTAVVFATDASEQALTALALFVAAGFRSLPSLVRLIASLNMIRAGRAGLELVSADLQQINAPTQSTTVAPPARKFIGDIRLEEVTFQYPEQAVKVLDRVDLTIPRGSSLAIVGGSGAGKSTLVDLMLGLHTPTYGRLLVEDQDLHSMLPTWHQSIGLVPQEVFLLNDSLRANIAFGEPPDKVDEQRVQRAVRLAQLQELVSSLEEGLDTTVGERGVRFSGGQRQRIGIARALYLEPQVLFLDEATSALDNETERKITETIQSLHGEITVVVVAHRLSTIRHCDQVVFLESGRVEARGTFEEVRKASEGFAHLVSLATLDGPSANQSREAAP